MLPHNKPQNAKIVFPPKKDLGDLGIYPTSPSYSLTLTFIEATIFTVFYWETKQGSAPLYHCSILLGDQAKFDKPVQWNM